MSATTGIKLPSEGSRLDRYTIVKRVSYGGFGAVYKAIQDTLGREVAIKVLLPEIFVSNKDYVEQFRQEALLTSQLRHPNTITIFDYGQTEDGLLYLVMEWLDGQTLADELRQHGAFSYERCYHISYQILKSLAEAHARGMVHRDLKPSNLFLCRGYGEEDYVKVLDFGLVKNLQSTPLKMKGQTVEPPKFTEKRRAPGTPHYMAPEQATGKGTTTSADMYSFGLILHEMLTGVRAVDGNDKMEVLLRQAREKVPPLPEQFRSTFLGKVVEQCVEKDPLKRPQKAADLIREYQRVEDSVGVEVSPADIRTTDHWKPLAKPRTQNSEVSPPSVPAETFIGRESELEEFAGLVEKRIQAGHGIVMTVSGPTGIGKSALVQRFGEHFAQAVSGRVVRGGFLPQDDVPLTGIRRALRSLLSVRADDHGEGRHEIRRGLQELGIDDIYLLNFLTHFLLGSFGSTRDELEQCASHVEGFLMRLAQREPVLLVVENLHQADAESLDLLWRLALSPVVRQTPLLLCATFRTHDHSDNRELQLVLERLNRLDHTTYREMRVGALGKRDCLKLISQAINMQRPMANRCLALSRGNPLYLNLVLRYLIDEAEYLSRQRGDANVASKLYLPSSLEKISLRRVEQVVRKYGQEQVRDVLRRAALVGESFSTALVEQVLRREGRYELLDKLGRTLELWRREGLLRTPWESVAVNEFVHPHLVEFFFAESEAKLHLLVAATKEDARAASLAAGGSAHADRTIDPASLARHYRAADDRERAIGYLGEAGRLARERGNFARARALYEELLPLLDDTRGGQRRELAKRVNFELGEICMRLSEFGPSSDYFQRAQLLAHADGDAPLEGLCFCGRADLALAQNLLDEADRFFHHARTLVRADDRLQQGRLLLGMGQVSGLKGDWEAAQSCFQRAYEHGAAIFDRELMARALHELGRTAVELGNVRAAHEWFTQSQRLYAEGSNAARESEVLLDLGETAYVFRRTDDARGYLERAIEIEQRLGDRIGVARALVALGELEANLLHVDEANKFVVRALPVFKTQNDAEGEARCKAVLARLELLQGYPDKAQSILEQARERLGAEGRLSLRIRLDESYAQVLLQVGHQAQAVEVASQALMLLDAHGSDARRCTLLFVLGVEAEQRGDLSGAEQRYRAAYHAANQAGWAEVELRARLGILRVNLFYQGGRWYYDELWELVNEARSYGMRAFQLEVLLCLVWFEGVYGDQPGWEAALGELTQHVRLQRIPGRGIIRTVDFMMAAVAHLMPDQVEAYGRSAGWIRQAISQTSLTTTAM